MKLSKKPRKISSLVWGPKFWFVLHCAAYNYPEVPNAITKRKYYDLVQNIPLFIPDAAMGDKFSVLLDKYPVSPYLCSRESFMRWAHYIHNKINRTLGKEEISLYASLDRFHEKNPVNESCKNYYMKISSSTKRQLAFATIIFLLILLILYIQK